MRPASAALLALAALAPALGPGSAHGPGEEPGLRSPGGEPALVGRLVGLHAPGALYVVPWREGPVELDGHVQGYPAPAEPAPGLRLSGLANATHLTLALDYDGAGWFLLGLDLDTASRALIAMRQALVARHAAVGGWVDEAGQAHWCAGQLGMTYGDQEAPEGAGHGGAPVHADEGGVLVAWDGDPGSCPLPAGVGVAGARSGASTRVEASWPWELLGARPGDVRHVVAAFEPERRFLTPKVTEQAVRGDLNLLLARPGDEPAALGALVRGAPEGPAGLALAAVPAGVLGLAWAVRKGRP